MKRLALLLCVFLALAVPSCADDADLSGYTLEQLILIKRLVNLEIWNRAEAKAVTVPQGTWLVGVDIPAGTYTLKCADLGRTTYMMHECKIKWGKTEPVNGYFKSWLDQLDEITLYNQHSDYFKGEVTEYIATFEDGVYIYIDPAYNKVTFYPYTGKPDLGFEW